MAQNLWEYYKSKGQQLPSVAQRRQQFGLGSSYVGSAAQNTALLSRLQGGGATAASPTQSRVAPAPPPVTSQTTSFVLGTPPSLQPVIAQAAQRFNVSPAVLSGLLRQESGFRHRNPDGSLLTSPAGALGIAQFMPETARNYGVNVESLADSIHGAARYLSDMLKRFGGNLSNALAGYNAGPGAVEQYGGVPPFRETQNYVSSILGSLREIIPGGQPLEQPTQPSSQYRLAEARVVTPREERMPTPRAVLLEQLMARQEPIYTSEGVMSGIGRTEFPRPVDLTEQALARQSALQERQIRPLSVIPEGGVSPELSRRNLQLIEPNVPQGIPPEEQARQDALIDYYLRKSRGLI